MQFETGLKAGDPSTTAAMNAIPAVRAEAATVADSIGAADYGVGGQAPAIYDISSISNSDLATVIPIAIVVIGILLALVMRSLVAPLYLIVSVGLSYLAALGLSVLLFVEIAGDGGLVFFLPFLMFIFLLALGEDYNILVMSRIREEAQRLPLKEAVSRALDRDRHHGHLGRPGARRHVRRLRHRGRPAGIHPVPRRRRGPRAGRPDGHLPRPHPAGAVHGRAARPVELVAVEDEPARRRPEAAQATTPRSRSASPLATDQFRALRLERSALGNALVASVKRQ